MPRPRKTTAPQRTAPPASGERKTEYLEPRGEYVTPVAHPAVQSHSPDAAPFDARGMPQFGSHARSTADVLEGIEFVGPESSSDDRSSEPKVQTPSAERPGRPTSMQTAESVPPGVPKFIDAHLGTFQAGAVLSADARIESAGPPPDSAAVRNANRAAALQALERLGNMRVQPKQPELDVAPSATPAQIAELESRIKRFRVLEDIRFSRGGGQFVLRAGKIITNNGYDIAALVQRGAKLEPIENV